MCRSVLTYFITILVITTSVGYIYFEIKKSQYNEELKKISTKTIIFSQNYFVNSFLHPIPDSKYILIDTLSQGKEINILGGMASRGIKTFEVLFIFITHHHFDHAGNAKTMVDASRAKIGVPKSEIKYIAEGVSGPRPLIFQPILKKLMSYIPKSYDPSNTPFNVDYKLNGDEVLKEFNNVKIISTPGHTNGSLSLVTESGDCFIGDVLSGAPFTVNYPMLHWFRAFEDFTQLKGSIKKLLNEKSCKLFFPGHGMPFTRKSLVNWMKVNEDSIEKEILGDNH
eukprot:gene3381-5926_t